MSNFVIRMMSGKTFKIDEAQMKKLVGMTGLVYVNHIGCAINTNSIEFIEPEERFLLEQKKTMTRGRLHDGTVVVKRYGSWTPEHDPKVRIDPAYYPEVAKDEVLSEEEWNVKSTEKKVLEAPEEVKQIEEKSK